MAMTYPKKVLIRFGLVLTFVLHGVFVVAQPLPPDDHGDDDNKPPHGSIGGGLLIMLSLGAVYGAKKVYCARKQFKR